MSIEDNERDAFFQKILENANARGQRQADVHSIEEEKEMDEPFLLAVKTKVRFVL